MSTILKNVVRFTGLTVGVPTALPHKLNVNGTPVAPQLVEPRTGGYTIVATTTTLTVTRTTGAPTVDVYVEHWHTIEAVTPPGDLAGLVPFVLDQGGGGSGSASSILWAPGGGGDATTWAEVMAFVAASNAPIDIYVNANATIPAGVYAMKSSNIVSDPLVGGFIVTMTDGAQLSNLGSVHGQIGLQGNSTAVTPLVFTPPGGVPAVLLLNFNGFLQNNGTVPMIEVPAAGFFVIAGTLNASLIAGTAPIINMGAGSTLLFGVFGNFDVGNDILSGPVGAMFAYVIQAGGVPTPLPTQAGYAGTTVQYVNTGVSCTSVATRPVNPFGPPGLKIGTMVFDQSLGATGKPIWWDGTQWVDATGAPA